MSSFTRLLLGESYLNGGGNSEGGRNSPDSEIAFYPCSRNMITLCFHLGRSCLALILLGIPLVNVLPVATVKYVRAVVRIIFLA